MSDGAQLLEQMPLTAAELVAALAAHEQQAAVLALAIRRLENTGVFGDYGAVNSVAWLVDQCRMSTQTARTWVHRGRFLDRYTAVADAAVSRTLSADQVAVMQRLHLPKYEQLLGDDIAVLTEVLAPLTVHDTATACALWRNKADAIIDDTAPPSDKDRSLVMGRAGDNALIGRFVLDDAAATEVEKAIATALTHEGDTDTRTLTQRQGDALFDIAAFYNNNHDRSDGTARHLPHVTLSADADTLHDTPVAVNDETGQLMSPACVAAYLCDCILHTILRDANGAPASFGRSTHTVPRKLFRQVAARDGGCRFPGCSRPVKHTHAHHIRWWTRDHGPTDYDNLILLCSRHHHLVHQQNIQLKLLPNGELHVTWPNGHERTTTPRGAPPKPPV